MQLEELNESHIGPWLKVVRDFQGHDRETASRLFGAEQWDEKKARKFIQNSTKEKMDWRPKAGKTSLTHYVLVDGGEIRGYGRLRFPVETEGYVGNLEFFVPPSSRGKAYGTHTLNRLLFEAVRAGLARALVVCRTGDPAAIRCIEHNRGVKIEEADSELVRYWIRFR